MNHTEQITINSNLIAIILYNEFTKDGIEFFSPDDFSQQLGYMKRKKGDTIQEHKHLLHLRETKFTQETLFIRNAGDVILLASGGHGFEFLEETEIIEVKQGPYAGDKDKVRFNGKINSI